MDLLSAYLPIDRCQAIAHGTALPDRTSGAALFADVSGFMPLAEALVKELGPKRGAEELTGRLNAIFDALIADVDRYGGSVITFAGDALTAWFDGDDGRRAVACGLAMQQTMTRLASIQTPAGRQIALAMKTAVAAGAVRRFQVGDPRLQLLDVLAGTTLDRMATAGKYALGGEVILDAETSARLHEVVQVNEWRRATEGGESYAVVAGLRVPVATAAWPPLDLLPDDLGRRWMLAPVYERLRAGQGQYVAEIRPTVTLFLSFTGIDYDADEDAGTKLDVYVRWAQNVINRFEGALLQLIMGDKGSYLYATFGAPLAHDDDETRALAAALELLTPPAEVCCVSGMRMGLSQGRIWSGAYGGSTRRTYGVLGETVNLAARLMDRAEPGQILVTQDIADAALQSYRCQPLGLVTVKGRAEPLRVAVVVGRRRSLPAPLAPYTQPLVGREAELAQLRQWLELAQQGEGQIVRLEGEEGVGKSHLAAALAAEASAKGWRVHMGACQSISQDVAYTPWRQVFRSVFDLDHPDHLWADTEDPTALAARQAVRVEAMLARLNPDWRLRGPLLGDLLGLPIPDNTTTAAFDARLRQEALFALAIEMARAYARQHPVLVLLEDAHWMDEASQGLTLAFGRGLARLPVVLVIIHRPSPREDTVLLADLNRLTGYHYVDLPELSAGSMAALIGNHLGGAIGVTALSLIQTQAQGNPFFARELVDALYEAGHLVQSAEGHWNLADGLLQALRNTNALVREPGGEWRVAPEAQLAALGLGIPTSIHGTVLSRLDRLSEQDKLTLKVACVIGRVFELDLLSFAHPTYPGHRRLLAQLQTFDRQGFTQVASPPPHTAYQFMHNITHEVLYDTLPGTQQRTLHLAVGQALERLRPEAVEQLAHHFVRAEAPDQAVLYLEKAAARAQRSYANETALHYYAQALALQPHWPARKGQIELLHLLGRREEEQAALQALEAMPEAPPYEVASLWGQYREAVSDYDDARTAVERALELARQGTSRLNEAHCLAQLGLIARRHGDYDRALHWYAQALQLFPGSTTTDEEARVLAQALNGQGTVHRQLGDFERARGCYERALALSRTSGNRRGEAEVLNSLGTVAHLQRHYLEAAQFFRLALETHMAVGDQAGQGMTLLNLSMTERDAGNYHQAQAYLSTALEIHQRTGNRWEEVNVLNGMGIIYQELGAWPQALACLQQGLTLSQEIGDQAGWVYILANMGLVMRDSGDLAAAEKLLSDGLAIVQKQNDKNLLAIFLSYLASIYLRVGKLDQAVTLAKVAFTIRKRLGLQSQAIADLTTLASAYLAQGQLPTALENARQASELLNECHGEGAEAPQYDYFVCHEVFATAGETETAQAALRAAYQLVINRANNIAEPALRQSFLEKVPANRQIMEAAQKQGWG